MFEFISQLLQWWNLAFLHFMIIHLFLYVLTYLFIDFVRHECIWFLFVVIARQHLVTRVFNVGTESLDLVMFIHPLKLIDIFNLNMLWIAIYALIIKLSYSLFKYIVIFLFFLFSNLRFLIVRSFEWIWIISNLDRFSMLMCRDMLLFSLCNLLSL